MKLNKWLYGVMGLAMLASCSDDKLGPDGPNPADVETGGEPINGYIAVQFKLPEEAGSTRADGDEDNTNYGGKNDHFDDGSRAEYTVYNGMIVLFKQTVDPTKNEKLDEKKAVFYRAQELTKTFFTNQPNNDQITSTYLATLPVTVDREENQHFFALVILNNNTAYTGVVEETDETTGEVINTYVQIAGQTLETEEATFEDFLSKITTYSFLGTNDERKFFMANAPLSTKKGGSGSTLDAADKSNSNIQYLAYLGTGEDVYDTPDLAKQHVKSCVYVERAVAKITYKNGLLDNEAISLTFVKDDGSEYTTADLKVTATVRYALNNTNTSSYVIRNVNFGTKDNGNASALNPDNHFSWGISTEGPKGPFSRMVGDDPVNTLDYPEDDPIHPSAGYKTHSLLYRTYWCKDPNYYTSMGTGKNKFTSETIKVDSVANYPFVSLNNTLYCKENTFTVRNMDYDNTTLAVFEVNYDISFKNGTKVLEDGTKISDHLFIKDGDKSKIYLSKEAVCAEEIKAIIEDPTLLRYLRESKKEGALTNDNYSVRDHLFINIKRKKDENNKDTQTLEIVDIQLQIPDGKDSDDYFDSASKTKFREKIGSLENEDSYLYKLLARVNKFNDITEYTYGISYYTVPIKHFAEYYTPWNTKWDTSDEITGITTEAVYNKKSTDWTNDDHAKKYLGRYGLVRNNWYELNITQILGLGEPTIPDNYDHLSDDHLERQKYFALEIHTLSWARRYQDIKFE